MSAASAVGGTGYLDVPPHALLDRPLEFFVAEHRRQRALFAAMIRLAESRPVPAETVDAMIALLRHGLAEHAADEERDLFPLLRRRCEPEDEIETVIERLSQDHRHDLAIAAALAAKLADARSAGSTVAAAERETLRRLAEGQHRHLAVEDGVILPMARTRLTEHDLGNLSRRMRARRRRNEGTAQGSFDAG